VWLGACAATGTVFTAEATPDDCDVLVVDRSHLGLAGTARDDVLVSLAPFGLPDRGEVPSGVIEAAVAIRGHPDVFVPWQHPPESMPLLQETTGLLTQGDVMDRAGEELTRRGVASDKRFALIDPDPLADLLALAGPLARGSSVVLVAHADSGDLSMTLREEGLAPREG
jgi:uncharacterized protein (TIGR03089 family)